MRLNRRKILIVWLIGLLVGSVLWVPHFILPGIFDRANNYVFDVYQRNKPRQWANSSVVVLDIDEKSVQKLGQWPWPRSIMAEITDGLAQMGAAAIAFDVVFSEPDRTSPVKALNRLRALGAEVNLPQNLSAYDNDRIFADSIARTRVVTGMALTHRGGESLPQPKAGFALSGSLPGNVMSYGTKAVRNLDLFDQASAGIGLFSLDPDHVADGVIREVRLLTGIDDKFYPTLAVEALRVAQGAGGFKIKSSDGSGEVDVGELRLTSVQVGALEIPTDGFGNIRIYHSLAASKPSIPAHQLLDAVRGVDGSDKLREMVEGRIVLIGASAAGLRDLRTTPLEPVVPGVFIHADIIDQTIAQEYLVRPDYAKGVELISAIGSSLVILLLVPVLNAAVGALVALILGMAAIWYFWIQFEQDWLLLSPMLTLASVLLVYVTTSAVQFLLTQRESAFLRTAFGQYLSPSLVDQLTQQPDKLILGGETRTLTLLFCDIRGFTSLSEKLGPTELTTLLNRFLTPMTHLLMNNGATIDKYMGDAIMAFWNAPIDQENHRDLACQSVLEMREALGKLNSEHGMSLEIGIGINTGPACVGNLGSEQRFSYSAIGDAVNVASRIEGLTKQYGLDNLVSGEAIGNNVKLTCLEIDKVAVVGRAEPITVYHLLSDDMHSGSLNKSISREHLELHAKFIATYRKAQFRQARETLCQLVESASVELQKLYAVYSDRIDQLEKSGVPENWDGVFSANQK